MFALSLCGISVILASTALIAVGVVGMAVVWFGRNLYGFGAPVLAPRATPPSVRPVVPADCVCDLGDCPCQEEA